MRVLGAGVFVLKTFDSDFFTLDSNYNGLEPLDTISYNIPITHPIVSFLAEHNVSYTLDEFEKAFSGEDLLEQIASLNPSLIVPLKQKNHLTVSSAGKRIDLGEGVFVKRV